MKKVLALIIGLIFCLSIVTAVETEAKKYGLLDKTKDKIKLIFTKQIEKKTELINKIQLRREEHYNFLIEKGKIEQAEAYKSKTIGIVKNFEEWKAKKLSLKEDEDGKEI